MSKKLKNNINHFLAYILVIYLALFSAYFLFSFQCLAACSFKGSSGFGELNKT